MEKKTKLTISGSAKKSIKNIGLTKTQGKQTVVIEKQKNNFIKKGSSIDHLVLDQVLVQLLAEGHL